MADPVLLYIETNFVLGAARGQEERGDELLAVPVTRLSILLPSLCLLEARVASEAIQKQNLAFRRNLKEQIIQLRRDLISPQAARTAAALFQADVEYGQTLEDLDQRFQAVMQSVTRRTQLLNTSRRAATQALAIPLLSQPRDNLILATILDHARRHPDSERVLLTNDLEWREPAQDAGLRFFARTEAFLGWFNSRL